MGFRGRVLGGSGLGFVGSARRAIVTERSCLVFWGLLPGGDSRSLLRQG